MKQILTLISISKILSENWNPIHRSLVGNLEVLFLDLCMYQPDAYWDADSVKASSLPVAYKTLDQSVFNRITSPSAVDRKGCQTFNIPICNGRYFGKQILLDKCWLMVSPHSVILIEVSRIYLQGFRSTITGVRFPHL